MKHAEIDSIEPKPPTIGGAEAVANDDEHGAHRFLYIPDITMETGWSAHKVPERETKTKQEPVGFRRA